MFFERTLLFPAPPVAYGNWDAKQYGAQEAFVDSTDNARVHVWSFLRPGATKTIIFAHGNGETLGYLGDEMAAIRDNWNVNVVAFDFRGYGKTGGDACEKNILSDSVAVANWVKSDRMFEGQKIIAMGRSLGGGCAIEIAVRCGADGVILDRTYSSIVEVAASRYFFFPVRWVMRNTFRSDAIISQYSGPLLQMHGKVDEVIPFRFGQKLFDACPSERKQFLAIDDLGHNDRWPASFWKSGKKFIEELSSE
jgi:uncharacterized protein